MADPNLAYDPVTGWSDETIFVKNPSSEAATRTLMQRLFTQIQTFLNTTLVGWVNATFATKTELAAAVISGVSDGSITTEKLADMTSVIPYGGLTTGVANTYILAAPVISALTAGMAVSAMINVDSTGASTLNWNGKGAKPIKKANGTDASVKVNGIYTMRYDGTNFILQGEGASGNATASRLLSGDTATVDAGEITGSMTDRTTGDYACDTYSVSGTTLKLNIPDDAFYGDAANIAITEANLVAANLAATIFGIAGTAKKFSTGTVAMSFGGYTTVTLGWRPIAVIAQFLEGSALYVVGKVVNPLDMSTEVDINNNGTLAYGDSIAITATGFNYWNATADPSKTIKYYAI